MACGVWLPAQHSRDQKTCRQMFSMFVAPLGPNRTRASAGVWVSLCCALSRWQTVVACSTCAQPHTCFGGCLGQPVLCFVEVADCRGLLHLGPTAHVLRRVSGSACAVLCRGSRLSSGLLHLCPTATRLLPVGLSRGRYYDVTSLASWQATQGPPL
jgi:hypothetical protein